MVAGTSLYQIIFTSAFSVMMHAIVSQTVDFILAFYLIAYGVIGVKFGVMFSRRITGARARVILALMVLAVCLQLGIQLFLQPSNLFEVVVE